MNNGSHQKSSLRRTFDFLLACFVIAVILFVLSVGLARLFRSCSHWMDQFEREKVHLRR